LADICGEGTGSEDVGVVTVEVDSAQLATDSTTRSKRRRITGAVLKYFTKLYFQAFEQDII
jgi:hypothetical protein